MSYYEDELSKWYISSNNNHSTFINQIKKEELKEQVDAIIESRKEDPSFDTRFNWEVKGNEEQFSIWIDNKEPNKNKLYRLTPGADSSSVSQEDKQSFGSGSGNSNKQDFSPKGFFDSKSHDLVLLEDYKEKAASDFTIRPLTTKEKTPNNFVFFKEGKMEVWLWIGKWIKPN